MDVPAVRMNPKGKMETVDLTDLEQFMDTCRLTSKVNDPTAIPGCD